MEFNFDIKIENYLINRNSPVYIIAEAGVNHGGDMLKAKQLIDIAVDAGANAVKFQTFKADHLILDNVVKAPYQLNTTDSKESQFNMLKRLEISREQNLEMLNYCNKKGITFLTTPFDEVSLDELIDLNIPAYKVASTDLTNLPFLEKIAKTGKPIILSTGMSYLTEINLALNTIYNYNKDVIVLQCTANYPIIDSEANLKVIDLFKKEFNCLIGYSDHSVGVGAAPFAVPMGVKVIEKHFTIDKNSEGPDHLASLSPDELISFIKTIRKVEEYMGDGYKYPTVAETQTRKSLQKCLVASQEIKHGDLFSSENIISKRTGGFGISPIYLNKIIGKTAIKDFDVNEIIFL